MENKQTPLTQEGTITPTTGGVSVGSLDNAQSLDQTVTSSTNTPLHDQSARVSTPQVFQAKQKPWKKLGIIGLIALLLVAGLFIFLQSRQSDSQGLTATQFEAQKLELSDITGKTGEASGQTLTVNGQLQVAKSLILSPTVQPASGVAGQIYYDQATNQVAYFNGTEFLNLVGSNTITTINNTFLQGGNINVTNVAEGATAGITTIGGTPNAILKFTSAQTAGDSILTDNSTYVNINGGININAATALTNLRFWDNNTLPANPDRVDTEGALEQGMKFKSDVNGVVNGLYFYRGTTSNGPYTGSLWDNTGNLLNRKAFTTSTTGWQYIPFDAPTPISPDTTYVISYHHGNGGYPADLGYFAATGVDNGPIHGLASGLDGPNGVFKYSATPTFPNQGFNASNYWVDVDFTGATYTQESRIRINGAQLSSGDLANDVNLAKRTSSQIFSGYNTFRPSSDSADAFSVQRSDTLALFTVDTLGAQIVIGRASDPVGAILVLGRRVATGDPMGVEGAIYFNSAQQSFRCYRGGTWENCAQPEVDRSFSQYEEFIGGQNNSFATNSFGTLGWQAQTIGANGSVTYDPPTPAPVADRPGVLAYQTPAASNQGNTFVLGNGGGSMLVGKSNIVKTSVAVGSTSQVLRVGLHNQTTATTQPVSGVWWEADAAVSPNWRYCYGNGTTAACTATTIAITPNSWVRLEIRIVDIGNGTSAYDVGINGAFAGQASITIDTTNKVSPALSCYATTSTAANCYWDYYQLKGTTSAAR